MNSGTASYKYIIANSTTGQVIVNPTTIPVGSGVVTGSPRVFLMGGYFIVVFTNVISGTAHLQFIAISTNSPTTVTTNADIAASYINKTTLSWDGIVYNNNLYIAYNTTSGGQQIKITYLNTSLVVASPVSFSGSICTIMSMTVDQTNLSQPVIYAAFWDAAGSTGYAVAVDQNLNKLMTATEWLATGTIANVTSTAQNGVLTIVYDNTNAYSYDSGIPSNFLSKNTVTKPATVTTGTVGTAANVIRSLGLASKGFLLNGTMYVLGTYTSQLQKTYFLLDINGNIISRFAYENGGGYLTTGLPQAQVNGTTVNIPYLYADLIGSQSTSGLTQSIGTVALSNIYSQFGVNLVSIDFTSTNLQCSEIGGTLNLTGGMLWSYDGQTISEQGFHLFPDNIEITTATTGGAIGANTYYYQALYEWMDAQGNINRSAPSIPVSIVTTGSTSSNTINVPYLRLTYKTTVKIIIYRWSQANQEYYQVTSVTAPTVNVKTSDSVAFVDTLADSSIVGNSLLYTTGGVVEDTPGPACNATTLFDDRLWLIDAEDPNILENSKQVIENTPVEMSDLFTTYVAPSTGAQGSTGDIQCIFPMDDKIIIFKTDALYYINGTGPDNTGANSQYSQPIFITSNIGSVNQNSIVLTPTGLLFQTDKGIWQLGRGLDTSYLGAPVEKFNSYTVNAATAIPATTQVRFPISNNQMLMYDFFFDQWGTFVGNPAVSATLYNLAGLQGYQRLYEILLLGQYLSPHQLLVSIAYDYGNATQQLTINPTNYTGVYGSDSLYGQTSPFGGSDSLEQWRIQVQVQKCQVFQITLQEIFNPAYGTIPGAGFTLSAITAVVGVKKGYRPFNAKNTVG